MKHDSYSGSHPFPRSAHGKDGVALVATLGLLAALLIMAFSYAAFMRTERMAASNFASIAKTRQLTLAALDTVLFHLNEDDDGLFPPSFETSKKVIPTESLLVPQSGEDADDIVYGDDSYSGTKHFFPLDPFLDNRMDIDRTNINSAWQELKNSDGDLMGVYAVVIGDESSAIDVNFAGSPEDFIDSEGHRNSPTNLFMQAVDPRADWPEIAKEREELFVRFYNPAELRHSMGDQLGLLSGVAGNSGWYDDRGFSTYAKYPQIYLVDPDDPDSEDKPRVEIDLLETELRGKQSEITTALQDAGYVGAEIADFYNALIDYVDFDVEPSGGPEGYTTEPVPMFSEIVVRAYLGYNPSGESDGNDPPTYTYSITNSYQVAVETWFPFVGAVTNAADVAEYQVQVRVDYSGNPAGGGSVPPLTILDFTVTNTTEFGMMAGEPKTVVDTITSPTSPLLATFNGARARVSAARIRKTSGPGAGATVDLLPGSQIELDLGSLSNEDIKYRVAQVNDPRRNGLAGDWDLNTAEDGSDSDWVRGTDVEAEFFSSGTLGDVNAVSLADPNYPDDHEIFIANRPLRNIGELGFLGMGYSRPAWTSVDMAGIDPAYPDDPRVFDVFTVQSQPEVFGLVNANARSLSVLEAALHGVARERYPRALDGVVLSPGEVDTLRKAIARAGTRMAGDPGGGFLNKSDLAKEVTDLSTVGATENERESILRNCMDLFDVRGNTHIIVLAVRAIRDRRPRDPSDPAARYKPNGDYDPDDDQTLGEQFAVAQVWRDPISGRSEVTFLKWVARSDN